MLSLIKSHRKSSGKEGGGPRAGEGQGSSDQHHHPVGGKSQKTGSSASRILGSVIGTTKASHVHIKADSSDIKTVELVQPQPVSGGQSSDEVVMRQPKMTTEVAERPQSRLIERPPSRGGGDRPPSRNRQPRLGVSSAYLFEDMDPGITSEVETSSTRFRPITSKVEGAKRSAQPRTSPNQAPRGYGPPGTQPQHRKPRDALPPPPTSSGLFEDDPGIMSEAETASTTRSKRKARQNLLSHSLGRNSHLGGKHVISSTLFEEDSGIMSEAETSSTSSKRRHEKYTLPVVRTPSKTLERPLGMVFLIYRGETKRAILPNEITSIITVKALFVRSFNKILTMDYMDNPRVKIYVHDSPKDVFYELGSLNDIKDRSILKVFEVDSSGKGPSGLGATGLPPITNSDEVPGMPAIAAPTSEPDYVDSRYVKASKLAKRAQEALARPLSAASASSSTLPRNAFSALDQQAMAISDITSKVQPKSNKTLGPSLSRPSSRLAGGSGRVESGYISSPDGNYEFDTSSSLHTRILPRFSSATLSHQGRLYPGPANTEEAKARMMHMEAQLNQLTGMVEKALKNKKLGKKQVSFDKSVTFSDDQPPSILTTSKRHHSQQQQQQQQQQLYHTHQLQHVVSRSTSNPELHGQLKRLHKSTKELKQEVKVLKRLTQLQSMAMKDLVQDTYLKLREACISFSSQNGLVSSSDNLERWRLAQDEEIFTKELSEVLQAIAELEAKVEDVRSGVINKKSKIMLQDVESMALSLSKCSKTVTQMRQAFPSLEANLRSSESRLKNEAILTDFLRKSSEKLESASRRCKKLTGTLVTLRRLASVQEQRFHPGSASGLGVDLSLSPTPSDTSTSKASSTSSTQAAKDNSLDDLLDALQTYTAQPQGQRPKVNSQKPQQGTASSVQTAKVKPQSHLATEETANTQKATADSSSAKAPPAPAPKPTPPCPPPRTTPSLSSNGGQSGGVATTKAAPPPPPPRTSSTTSKSTAPALPDPSSKPKPAGGRAVSVDTAQSEEGEATSVGVLRKANSVANGNAPAVAPKPDVAQLTKALKQDDLETRHQELLTRQKQLQEQYQRLQEMQKKSTTASSVAAITSSTPSSNGNGTVPNQSLASPDPQDVPSTDNVV